MVSEDQLKHQRSVLVASIQEVTGVAREVNEKGGDWGPYLDEVQRVMERLRRVQREIEKHDLD